MICALSKMLLKPPDTHFAGPVQSSLQGQWLEDAMPWHVHRTEMRRHRSIPTVPTAMPRWGAVLVKAMNLQSLLRC